MMLKNFGWKSAELRKCLSEYDGNDDADDDG